MNRTTLLAFLVPFFAITVVGAAAIALWDTGPPPCESFAEVAVGDLDLDQRCVRVHGMAHYGAVIRQRVQPRFPWQEEERVFLFPLFEEGDAENRAIRVLVRTAREPERFVHYEVLTVEGRLERPTEATLPYNTQINLDRKTDYFLTDEALILRATRIESEDGVWLEGAG